MCGGQNWDIQIEEALKCLGGKYREVVETLLESLKKAETDEKKKDVFTQFAEQYTIIPPLWNFFIESLEEINNETDPKYDEQCLHARSDFYNDYFIYKNNDVVNVQGFRNYFTKFSYWTTFFSEITDKEDYYFFEKYAEEYLKNRSFALKFFEKLVTFPHHELERAYKKLEKYSDYPIPKDVLKKYEVAKECVKKWDAKEDEYEWIEQTFEYDLGYAIQCFECFLNYFFTDVKFWKKYIAALKSQNVKVMLQVMSRYIRLFVNDTEMKESYEKECSETKNIPGFDDLPDLKFYLSPETFTTEKTSKMDINYFTNSKNLQQQNLSFKLSLVNYLIQNGDHLFLQKLQKTCRFFSSLKAIPICHQLVLSSKIKSSKYETQSLKVKILKNFDNVDSEELESNLFEAPVEIFENLYISNRIYIKTEIPCYAAFLVSKLYKCDARFIELHGQNLTWKEFNFLTYSKKLKNLIFDCTDVYEDDKNVAPLEDLIIKLSHVSSIEILGYRNITSKTCENLSTMDLNCKFEFCGLGNFNAENFNVVEYAKFIENHFKRNSVFEISFSFDSNWNNFWPIISNAREQLKMKFIDHLDPAPRNSGYGARIDLDFA